MTKASKKEGAQKTKPKGKHHKNFGRLKTLTTKKKGENAWSKKEAESSMRFQNTCNKK